MKRRSFIVLASAGVAVLAVPTLVYSLHENKIDSILFQPHSLASIWDTDTMNTIGLNYMLKVPKESRERVLVKHLMGNSNGEEGALSDNLDQQIKNDFLTGNTVMVDGWILSVTEARQCALLSLTLQKG